MGYYLDDETVTLDDLQKRIEETDLVPSRSSLLDDLNKKLNKLKKIGVVSLADLRKQLKTTKHIISLANKAEIDSEYLTLLRREIEGYFPKAFPIKSFEWLQKQESKKLDEIGLKNSVTLYEALNTPQKRSGVSNTIKIDIHFLDLVFSLVDLTRIQWVSPTAARMLVAAGYETPKKVAKADAEKLCNAVDQVNKENKYFKGKIGLRDIKRLVKAASYVS